MMQFSLKSLVPVNEEKASCGVNKCFHSLAISSMSGYILLDLILTTKKEITHVRNAKYV